MNCKLLSSREGIFGKFQLCERDRHKFVVVVKDSIPLHKSVSPFNVDTDLRPGIGNFSFLPGIRSRLNFGSAKSSLTQPGSAPVTCHCAWHSCCHLRKLLSNLFRHESDITRPLSSTTSKTFKLSFHSSRPALSPCSRLL